MKNTKKVMALTAAAVMALSALPVTYCSAADYTAWESPYISPVIEEKTSLEFVVIMWSENEDGTITITGCSPMYSTKVSDYPTSNVVGSFVYNGTLELPSHISGKEVTKIGGINIAKTVGAKNVIVSENITEISENAFGKGVTVLTTDEELRLSPVYY